MFQINIFGVQKHRNLCADYDIRCTKLFEVCSSKMEVISLEQSKIEEIICKLDSNHPLRNACNTEYQNYMNKNIKYSQNFLTSEKVLNQIIKQLNLKEIDTVYEIGTGKGHLTTKLAKISKQVTSIE